MLPSSCDGRGLSGIASGTVAGSAVEPYPSSCHYEVLISPFSCFSSDYSLVGLCQPVELIGLPSEPFFIDVCCHSFCRFFSEAFFNVCIPILIPFLAWFSVLCDFFCCGSQPVEESRVFRCQWVRVKSFSSHIIKIGLLLSGVLSVVAPTNSCEQCTGELSPVVCIQGGLVSGRVVAPLNGGNYYNHRSIEVFHGEVNTHGLAIISKTRNYDKANQGQTLDFIDAHRHYSAMDPYIVLNMKVWFC